MSNPSRIIVLDLDPRPGVTPELDTSDDDSINSSFEEDEPVEEYQMRSRNSEPTPDSLSPPGDNGIKKITPKSVHVLDDHTMPPGIAHPHNVHNMMAMLQSMDQKMEMMNSRMQHTNFRLERLEQRQNARRSAPWFSCQNSGDN